MRTRLARWTATLLIAIFFTGWQVSVRGEPTLAAALFFLILCAGCHAAGTVITRALPVSFVGSADYPFSFLLGYLFISSTLFLLALISPFGVKINAVAMVAGVGVVAFATRRAAGAAGGTSLRLGYFALAISLCAATLWAQDSLRSSTLAAAEPSLTHWPDGFYHARLISMFANQALGAPIQRIDAAGEAAKLYHYATYMLPAALSAFTATPAYDVYSAFLIPVGIFLTGLAAYGIGKAFWGEAGGIAATVALLLLPDAAQQGIHNHWYSYHFLQQVAPAGLYGVVIIAVAWIYMFDACKNGRLVSLGVSYLLAAVCITYKAQIFVANAFLLLVFPALFFGSLSVNRRLAWAALASVSYWLALKLAEGIPSVPTIKLDIRSLLKSAGQVVLNFDNASIRTFLQQAAPQATDTRFHSLAWIAGMTGILIIVTFGWFAPLYAALAWRLRKAASPMTLFFPLLVMLVYIAMSVALAPNATGTGHVDELTHRPFVWAYFVVCTWVGGAMWLTLSQWLPDRHRQWVASAAVALLSLVPATLGKSIELGPTRLWSFYETWWQVPGGLVRAAGYIRDHSNVTDVVQDSQGDSRLLLTGLSERQPYTLWDPANLTGMPPINRERFAEMVKFKSLTRREEIIAMARRYRIRWFVAHPEDALGWPRSVVDSAVFESDGYRVYAFDI